MAKAGRWRVRAAAGLLAVMCGGCDEPPTGLLAVVGSNLGARLSSVTLTVNDGTSEQQVVYSLLDGRRTLPGSVSIVPTEGSLDRTVRIEATATLSDGSPSFSQVARVNFRRCHVLQVDLYLAAECADPAVRGRCEAMGQTCGAGGACVPIFRESPPDVIPGPVVPRIDGGAPASDLGADTGADAGDAGRPDVPADVGMDVPMDVATDRGAALDAPDAGDAGAATDTPDAPADAGLRCDDAGCYPSVLSVGAGASNTCVVVEDGRVFCLGLDLSGVLGGGAGDGGVGGMTEVRGIPPMVDVTLDGNFACARTAAGAVWCWGDNRSGQLGTTIPSPDAGETVLRPVQVSGLTDVRQVMSGSGYSCALRGDATLWCWGANGANQLGRGTAPAASAVATQVPGLTGVRSASVGGHTCAVDGAGVVSCWGPNAAGQINGVASATTFPMPTVVAGVPAASAVAVGRGFTCALLQTGDVWCWGENTAARLGRSTATPSALPGAVPGLSGAVGLSGGTDGMCARLGDGRVSCFGIQRDGELGVGTMTGTVAPAIVTGLAAVTALTSAIFSDAPALSNHRCALTGVVGARRRVYCWGPNGSGQLGEGTRTTALRPVAASLFP